MDYVPLSALDHAHVSHMAGPIALVFRYPNPLDAGVVADAYLETARKYTGLTGTLVKIDDRTLGFDVAGDPLVRITSERPDSALSACIDMVGTEVGKPLARARIAHLGDQGTAISLCMSHAVADGYGFFLFMSAWAAKSRAAKFYEPNQERSLLTNQAARVSDGSVVPERLPESGLVVMPPAYEPGRSYRLEERVLPSATLKTKLPGANGQTLSGNDLLAASVWKELAGDVAHPTTTLACPVDVRQKRPDLGPLYFGNAVVHAPVTVETEALRTATPEEVASWIRSTVANAGERSAEVVNELERLRATHGLDVMARIAGYPLDSGVLVSNLSRIPLAPLDFGAGPPDAVEIAAVTPRSRFCFVLPAGDNVRLALARPGETGGPAIA